MSNLFEKLRQLWKGKPDKLLTLLEDRTIPSHEREDAATYLIEFYEPEVMEALVRVAVDPSTEPDLADSCGEALGTMMVTHNDLRIDILKRLRGISLDLAVGTIVNWKPEWRATLRENKLVE